MTLDMDSLAQLFHVVLDHRAELDKRFRQTSTDIVDLAVVRAALAALDPTSPYVTCSWGTFREGSDGRLEHLKIIDRLYVVLGAMHRLCMVTGIRHQPWLPAGFLRRRYVEQALTSRLVSVLGSERVNVARHKVIVPSARVVDDSENVSVELEMLDHTDRLTCLVSMDDMSTVEAFRDLDSFWDILQALLLRNLKKTGIEVQSRG